MFPDRRMKGQSSHKGSMLTKMERNMQHRKTQGKRTLAEAATYAAWPWSIEGFSILEDLSSAISQFLNLLSDRDCESCCWALSSL